MLMQNGLKLIGFATPSKLIVSCAGIVGGGIVLSITTNELSSQQISSAFSSAYRSIAGLFQPKNSEKDQSNNQNNFLQSLTKQITSVFEIVKKYFEPIFNIFTGSFKSLESLFKTLKEQQNSSNGGNQIPTMTLDSKSLWNGAFTLLGFKYRDIFEVEFGAFLYFLFNALFDLDKWNFLWKGDHGASFYQNWINLDKWKNALKGTEKFEERMKGFLFLLWNINKLGELETNNHKKPNQELKRKKISRNNMFALAYSAPWAINSVPEGQQQDQQKK
ncbi:hypothetical protein [Mycoplasma parvum]|uniref:Uncharacterized protein n=1 Tax=Mycoplasma parvum str. Indiana TaxID=1403316 RepID=U5NC59_9MOLU|nr:hypothetical protein [Mycoplasma parvum]AGX88875.1 hypothetical protein PRV_00530 [Mycoplasma parvum str. Indiana]